MTTLHLPWPPKALSPNARTHWRPKSKATKGYRTLCWALALEAKAEGRILRVIFHPPDGRKRDDDNIIASFKAGRDGIADATKVNDHHYRPEYVFGDPVRGGKIIVITGE